MPHSDSIQLQVPEPINEWVQANPLPTLLSSEGLESLVANEAFYELLDVVSLTVEDFLEQHLMQDLPDGKSSAEFAGNLRSGECVVKRLTLPDEADYTFHLAKITLSSGSCLCCMLVPREEPAQARLAGILNAIACFVAEIDSAGNVFYINDRMLDHLGYGPGDALQLPHLRHIQATFQEDALRHQIQQVDSEGLAQYRTKFRKKDGTTFAMEVSIVASRTPGESLYLLTARDISSQVAHEDTMKDSLVQAELDLGNMREENRRLRADGFSRKAADTLVYESKAFEEIVRQIEMVAPTDSTVLITGETGTGKGLIAKAIHQMSTRADKPFVTVDCGSLPPELIESELFGSRKGAFTGAVNDRPGRFAAAHTGTIFLDEIGELPLLMQTRLLRVLQEGQYSPVGDTAVHHVDVRVIAATNRDLQLWVDQGKFRSDLFFRLNVFPIRTIPLRERKEDIPALIRHFIRKFNDKFSKNISGLDDTTLDRIAEYPFPGNVRELENMVERAFIVASGQLLPLAVPQLEPDTDDNANKPILDLFDGTLTEFLSFEDYQRKYIQLVLDSTDGRVSGKGGAAEILKIHPQTLFSKMRKLGIRR